MFPSPSRGEGNPRPLHRSPHAPQLGPAQAWPVPTSRIPPSDREPRLGTRAPPTPALTWRAGPGRPTPASRPSRQAPDGPGEPGDERRRALPANQAQRPRRPASPRPAPPAVRPRAAEAQRRARAEPAPRGALWWRHRTRAPALNKAAADYEPRLLTIKICLKYTHAPVDTLQTFRWAPRLPAPASPCPPLRGPMEPHRAHISSAAVGPAPGKGAALEGGCFLRAMQCVPRPCRTECSLCWRHKEATVRKTVPVSYICCWPRSLGNPHVQTKTWWGTRRGAAASCLHTGRKQYSSWAYFSQLQSKFWKRKQGKNTERWRQKIHYLARLYPPHNHSITAGKILTVSWKGSPWLGCSPHTYNTQAWHWLSCSENDAVSVHNLLLLALVMVQAVQKHKQKEKKAPSRVYAKTETKDLIDFFPLCSFEWL